MRAQIKMFESIGVMVVFFFLVVFGLSFWFSSSRVVGERDVSRVIDLNALQIGQRALHMPEFECNLVGVSKDNCLDKSKVLNFASISSNEDARLTYVSIFGDSVVSVREVYPVSNFSAVIYDNKVLNASDVIAVQNPVLLYDSRLRQYSFGVLEVKSYAKR